MVKLVVQLCYDVLEVRLLERAHHSKEGYYAIAVCSIAVIESIDGFVELLHGEKCNGVIAVVW